MSQRLSGEPPSKSSTPEVLVAIATVIVTALLASTVMGEGDDDGGGASAGTEQALDATATSEPTAKERRRAEEQARRRRAKRGERGVFQGAGAGPRIFGKAGAVTTYSVVTEEATGVKPSDFAADVDRALSDPQSWTAPGTLRLERVKDGEGAVRIVLGTPATVDELCLPLDTIGQFSCRQGNQVNINLDRWLDGTEAWPLSVKAYRNHVINHEFGHFLGFDHLGCPKAGALAPVMMQQTKGLEGCKANEWPYPKGKAGG